MGELLAAIQLGQDAYLAIQEVRLADGKVRGPSQTDVADELAALANSRGGVPVLGVADNPRDVVGIPTTHLDAVEALVRQACEDSIKPPLAPTIERTTLPDANGVEQAVLRVEVMRSLWVHQSPGGYLHRVGSSKRVLSPDMLARLFQQRSQTRLIRFDEEPIANATLSDLDFRLWDRFAGERAHGPPEDILRKLGMAAQAEDGVVRPTVAGVLMACRDPRQFLPNAFIQAVAYSGTDIRPDGSAWYQRDAADLVGTLDQQIAGACMFVRRNMRILATKSLGREDVPQFDETAVLEAVVNAVAHRDYSMYGSKVRLRMFDDRLELYSPGAIPNSMTVESLPYRQSSRNEALTALLARCPVPDQIVGSSSQSRRLMEKRGEGVPLILRRSRELSGKDPWYRSIDHEELLLVIYAAQSPTPAESDPGVP